MVSWHLQSSCCKSLWYLKSTVGNSLEKSLEETLKGDSLRFSFPEFLCIATFPVQKCFIPFCLSNNKKIPILFVFPTTSFTCLLTLSLFCMPFKAAVHQQIQKALVQVLSFCFLKHYKILHNFSPAFFAYLQRLFYEFLLLTTLLFSFYFSSAIPSPCHQTWIKINRVTTSTAVEPIPDLSHLSKTKLINE